MIKTLIYVSLDNKWYQMLKKKTLNWTATNRTCAIIPSRHDYLNNNFNMPLVVNMDDSVKNLKHGTSNDAPSTLFQGYCRSKNIYSVTLLNGNSTFLATGRMYYKYTFRKTLFSLLVIKTYFLIVQVSLISVNGSSSLLALLVQWIINNSFAFFLFCFIAYKILCLKITF